MTINNGDDVVRYEIELTDAQAERLVGLLKELEQDGEARIVCVDDIDDSQHFAGNVVASIASQIAAERDRNRPLAVGDKIRVRGFKSDGCERIVRYIEDDAVCYWHAADRKLYTEHVLNLERVS